MSFPKSSMSKGIGIILLVLCVTAPTADAQQGVTVETVVKAWKARRERARSFAFSIKGTQFDAKGSANSMALAGTAPPPEFAIPPEDTLFDIEMEFFMAQDGRMRVLYEGKAWSFEKEAYVPTKQLSTFDGEVVNSYFPLGDSSVSFPSGHISAPQKENGWVRRVQVLPIIMAYRPLDEATWLYRANELLMLPERGAVNDRPCLILKHPQGTVWVDPAREFVPVRAYSRPDSGVQIQREVSYSRDATHGWVPTAWKVSLSEGGRITQSYDMRVANYEINTEIPDEEFRVEYAPGTYINNYIENEQYIVREGGGRRPILKGEFNGKNFEALLNSEPPLPGGRSRWIAILLINIILLAAVVGGFCVYRRRARAGT